MLAPSPNSAPTVLVASISGRALAQAARRAGYRVLVADFFGDDDTLAAADGFVRLPGDLRGGVDAERVVEALGGLCREYVGLVAANFPSPSRVSSEPPLPHFVKGEDRHVQLGFHPLPPERGERWRAKRDGEGELVSPIHALILGSGFERLPDIVDDLTSNFPFAGNSGETIRRIKDPQWLASACEEVGIPHPEISFDPPRQPKNWMVKRAGGAGGTHVRRAGIEVRSPDRYFQRRLNGESVSALFVADGQRAHIAGFSKQWTSPAPGVLYRYGGAVRFRRIDREHANQIGEWLNELTWRARLVGLCSADFIRNKDGYTLIEINPRPGATLDIFDSEDKPLIQAHLDACGGSSPALPDYKNCESSLIAYADRAIGYFPTIDWPDWVQDRQPPGTSLDVGDPICTVFGSGASAREARQQAQERHARLRQAWRAE